jgi:hypothetical protein
VRRGRFSVIERSRRKVMDSGEQTTGTRDEHYDLVGVLYHALRAAETMEAYILDAEAVGDERLASFFREAQAVQRQLAERAKGMLGILEVPPEPGVVPDLPPEGGVSPGEISSRGLPPEDGISPRGRVVPDTGAPDTELLEEEVASRSTDAGGGVTSPGEVPPERSTRNASSDLVVSRSSEVPSATEEPSTTGVRRTSPSEDVKSPDEEISLGDVTPGVPAEATAGRIVPEDLDSTISALLSGVEDLPIERALSEIDGWERKLEESDDPQLAPIAENLRQLRALLTASSLDGAAIGVLLSVLGEQVQSVASGSLGESVAGRLQQLGGLLATEGRAISG